MFYYCATVAVMTNLDILAKVANAVIIFKFKNFDDIVFNLVYSLLLAIFDEWHLLSGILPSGILLSGILLNSILLNSILLNSILLNSILLNSILLNSILLNSILLNSILLNSILLNSILLNSILLSDILLSVILLSGILMSGIQLGIILLIVSPAYLECHSTLRHFIKNVIMLCVIVLGVSFC